MLLFAQEAIIQIDVGSVKLSAAQLAVICGAVTGGLGTAYKLGLGYLQSREARQDAALAAKDAVIAAKDALQQTQSDRMLTVATNGIQAQHAVAEALAALSAKVKP